jgi:hypothetical protein
VAVEADDETGAARRSAEGFARLAGAQVSRAERGGSRLLFIGSRPRAKHGHVMLGAHAERVIHRSTVPVVAVARGEPLELAAGSVAA